MQAVFADGAVSVVSLSATTKLSGKDLLVFFLFSQEFSCLSSCPSTSFKTKEEPVLLRALGLVPEVM